MNYKIKKGDINTYINARVRFECDSKIIAMAICLPFIIYSTATLTEMRP